MPNIDVELINDGVKAAVNRASIEMIGDIELPDDFVNTQKKILEKWHEELSPRFIKLIVELVAIATISRTKFQHPPLTDDEINRYISHSTSFFNSFKHR